MFLIRKMNSKVITFSFLIFCIIYLMNKKTSKTSKIIFATEKKNLYHSTELQAYLWILSGPSEGMLPGFLSFTTIGTSSYVDIFVVVVVSVNQKPEFLSTTYLQQQHSTVETIPRKLCLIHIGRDAGTGAGWGPGGSCPSRFSQIS